MRQQLRLKILLPVAVLGLLGAGVGAFAGGNPPDTLVIAPSTSTTTAVPTISRAAWAKQANAICKDPRGDDAPATAETIVELEGGLAQAVTFAEAAGERLAALGPPEGAERRAEALLASWRKQTDLLAEMHTALRKGRAAPFRAAGKKLAESGRRFGRLARELDLQECAEKVTSRPPEFTLEQLGKALLRQPEKALNLLLLERGVVVVVFYRAESPVDAATVLASRSATVATHAGWLPVNVRRNGVVSPLATKYEVHSSPAVLVVTRGPKLAAHFDRYVDRETIAQAIESARR